MSLTGTYRARTQNVRLLVGSIRAKIRRRQRHAFIGIFGCRLTGKQTLASRFNAMNQGPFQNEVPIRYYYTAYIDLDTRNTNGTGDVFLTTYVIPPPLYLPEEIPPGYFTDMIHFCAMIFLCSVINNATFHALIPAIQELREVHLTNGLPHFLIVGNKIDLDRFSDPRHFTFDYASNITHTYFGVNYKECSARENIYVDLILEEILEAIIAEQP